MRDKMIVCRKDGTVFRTYQKLFADLNVRATPRFAIGGTMVRGAPGVDSLKRLVAAVRNRGDIDIQDQFGSVSRRR